jgi:tight adherence protein C
MKQSAFILLFFSTRVFASVCGVNSFASIEQSCVETFNGSFEELEIPLSVFKAGEVYLYQTDLGDYGKFFVHSIEAIDNQCGLYVEHERFQGQGKKSSTFSIKNYLGVWDRHDINFDTIGNKADFRLNYKEKPGGDSRKLLENCIFESVGGKIVKVGRINDSKESEHSLLFYFSIILIGIAVFNITRTIFDEEDQFKTTETIEQSENQKNVDSASNGLILKYSRPFFKRYFVPIVQGMKNQKKITDKYRRVIAAAGLTKKISPQEFFSFKLFLIIGFPIVYLGLREFLEADWALSFTPLMAILGFIYPDIWVKSRAEQRKKEVIDNLPFLVDMLALSVEAGLDFVAAMNRVLQKAPKSALVSEFDIVVKEIQIGSTRAQALKQLAWRVDELAITSFCATLIAADSVGASIGPILKSLAGELRVKRSAMIEKKGAAASTKLLLPMIFFIMPSIFIVIFAPMVLDFFGG